ncbi:uncharacterized protein BXZ73DRAFT_75804 [Epithele typhae]|uniref:uncharacterized protein n=1 Tax=Epithele typhae TaxID=378194 RepID=UPI0020077CF7|nr:uncharacterized protein BXZ73DRAFT_75804 [Epithele typhae]KAH9940211.1 hypothetical protein BXZ73DRAFT_75804 [Epithele typhae]
MPHTLPLELWDLVIDAVNTPAALQQCALVCARWQTRAQFRLFSTINLLVGDVTHHYKTGETTRRTEPGQNLCEVLDSRPALALHVTSLVLHHTSFHYNTCLSCWKEADIVHWPSLFPKLQKLTLAEPESETSFVPFSFLLRSLLNAPPSLHTLILGGVHVVLEDSQYESDTPPSIRHGDPLPALRHLIAKIDDGAYIRGGTFARAVDINVFLHTLTRNGLVPRHTLVTLDLPQYWDFTQPLTDFDATFPHLEHFRVLLSHSEYEDPSANDVMHQNTRSLFDALTGCPRLRVLDIIYGEPMQRTSYLLRRERISDSLVLILDDHFSRAVPPHPKLEEFKLSITYRAQDVERGWVFTLPRLAATLRNRTRYPALHRVSVCARIPTGRRSLVSGTSPDDSYGSVKRLFESTFSDMGVQVKVELMFGEDAYRAPQNTALVELEFAIVDLIWMLVWAWPASLARFSGERYARVRVSVSADVEEGEKRTWEASQEVGLHSRVFISAWTGDDIVGWSSVFPNLERLVFIEPGASPSLISLRTLLYILLNAPPRLHTLLLRGVDITTREPDPPVVITTPSGTPPCLRHITVEINYATYLGGVTDIVRADIRLLFNTLARHGLVSPQTLVTLDLPLFWDFANDSPTFDTTLVNLEHLGVLLSHPRWFLEDDPSTDHFLEVLASFPRLRVLDITYGEPDFRLTRSLRGPTLSDTLVRALADHFSRAPALHPELEELRITLTYRAEDIARAWSTPALPQLAATLADRGRHPSFRFVHARVIVPASAASRDFRQVFMSRGICARLFAAFVAPGVDVGINAEFGIEEDGSGSDGRLGLGGPLWDPTAEDGVGRVPGAVGRLEV